MAKKENDRLDTPMTVEYRNLIGYKLLMLRLKKEGIRLNSKSSEEIYKIAEETGINVADLRTFISNAIKEVTDTIIFGE